MIAQIRLFYVDLFWRCKVTSFFYFMKDILQMILIPNQDDLENIERVLQSVEYKYAFVRVSPVGFLPND